MSDACVPEASTTWPSGWPSAGRSARLLCDHLGMHVIEETDSFTLVGVDAKLGKLTLFDAEPPRAPGALERVVLRVRDLDDAVGRLPVEIERDADGRASSRGPRGCGWASSRPTASTSISTTWCSGCRIRRAPRASWRPWASSAATAHVAVADRHVRLLEGRPDDGGRPLLNHLAVLVESARDGAGPGRRARASRSTT